MGSKEPPGPASVAAERRRLARLGPAPLTSWDVRLILASASPARLRVLRGAGLDPEVVVSGVDEESLVGSSEEVTRGLAVRKAQAVARTIDDDALVLGCDTVLDLDGVPLGKPASATDAVERWAALRGRTGHVLTGHCLISTPSRQQVTAVTRTSVTFGRPNDAEVRAYVASGEPQQVAGAFTIDRLGGWFVERIDGDHSNVIGLSLPTLRELLGRLDVSVPTLWSDSQGP